MTEDRKIENVEETISKDKISELPEDLLVTILSLVPTKDAVATMVLSKRWLSVWTMIPTLEYKDSDVKDYAYYRDDYDDYYPDSWYKEFKKSYWDFLDKSMNSTRHLFELAWPADPTSLTYSLYSCQSLVKLTLCHKILVDVPSPACLPSLRKLELNCVVYKDDDSLARFLSGCPVLKCLYVKRKAINDNVKKFTIKVPSLLKLEYNRSSVYDVDDAVVIDTPILEDFCIFFDDFSGDSISIENMPFLKCAFISVGSCTYEMFLSSVSSVSSVEFFLSDEMVACSSTINFSSLLKLKICPRESDWLEPLISLLENSPKLKELWVDCDYWGSMRKDITLSWNQPISTPGCLSSQLETFKWKAYEGTEGEEQFLKYVLANSKCLNTAIISLQYTLTRNDEEEHLMKEKLKHIPRASATSQLLFENIPFI